MNLLRRIPLDLVAVVAFVAFAVTAEMVVVKALQLDVAGPFDGSPSVREQPTTIAVSAAATTALVPAAYTTPTSGRCVVPDATPVFVVAETATSTASGDGPYCTTCIAGPLIPVAGRAWARTSSGSATLSCRFVDDGAGFGGGGGGLSSSLVCMLTGGADCQLPSVRGSTFGYQDTNGVVDVQVSTAPSASGGGVIQIIDPRTTLAATACDASSEVGQLVVYTDAVSSSDSFCACERIAGVIGWQALTPSGDCTP